MSCKGPKYFGVGATVLWRANQYMPDFDSLRQNMVNSQLRTNKVTDERILLAMGKIPRESFAPARLAELAYIDEDIPIGSGRSMLEPMIFARMVQATNLDENDVVLDVASGAGYSASILGCIARVVVALESNADLAKKASSKKTVLFLLNAP